MKNESSVKPIPMKSFNRVVSRRQAVATLAAGLTVPATMKLFDNSWVAPASADELLLNTRTAVSTGGKAAVATVHPLATRAAMNVFNQGGNAFDAAVAAALMLGVVDGHNSGIGGGCFILARAANRELIAIDGREAAPGQAHRDMFMRNGIADSMASQLGPLASGVPGQVDALSKLSLGHGRIGWGAGLSEAAGVATEGYQVGVATESAIRCMAERLKMFPASKAQFLNADGSPPSIGDTLRQPDLGRTLAALADEGADWFYRGPFATACEKWMSRHGGILNASDFSRYSAKVRQPLRTIYRQWEVIGFPPPSSGGIHIAQMLMMLEPYDVKAIFKSEPTVAVHLVAEVMKRAFADRAFWLGDADHADVPLGLIDRQYCIDRASTIDLNLATPITSSGKPPNAETSLFSRQHTTHLTTADAEGNWVAITNTINTTFGSCVVIPGTGVVMNNEMDDFSISPGTPNLFGLIGAEANSIAPSKRPLSSMSPTIVLDANGNPQLTCGAAGGPRIISAVLQCLIGVLDRGMNIEEALAAPRVHHQWSPNLLLMEPQWDQATVAAMSQRGHKLAAPSRIAVAQAIQQAPSGELLAASEPRIEGAGAAIQCS